MGLCGLASAQPAASLDRGFALAGFWDAARTQRADIIMIGDSNILFQGNGWEAGWITACSSRFGIYATGLMSSGSGNGNGFGEGDGYSSVSLASGGDFKFTGAPAFFDQFASTSLTTIRYAYIPNGSKSLKTGSSGMGVFSTGPLDVNSALRFRLVLGEFNDPGFFNRPNPKYYEPPYSTIHEEFPYDGSESFREGTSPPPPPPFPRPSPGNSKTVSAATIDDTTKSPGGWFKFATRLDEPPYSPLAAFPLISTLAPVDRLKVRTFDLPAGVRNKNVSFRLYGFNDQPIIGPFLALYQRVEQVGRSSGVSISSLAPLGGRNARDMAIALIGSDDRTLTKYFEEVRALQGPTKHVLFRICTGLNDRNERNWAVGPIATLGSGPDAYQSNIMAIILRIQEIWSRNGWPQTELYFLMTPSHPVSTPDDPKLVSYRVAAQTVAKLFPRTAAVRLDQLTNSAEMTTNVYYNPPPPQYPEWGIDYNHLTRAGAIALSNREIDFLLARSCATDWNGDGNSDATDLAIFADAVTANSPLADFNEDGVTDSNDITTFSVAMAGGCR